MTPSQPSSLRRSALPPTATTPTRSRAAGRRRLATRAIAAGAGLAAAALLNALRARQAEIRHPPVGRLVEVEGMRVHVLERGSGPAVVLLHGNGSMAQDFAVSGLLDRLARRFRTVAIDRPGYGHSGRPRDRLWTPAVQARLIGAAARQLGLEAPIVVGHSWGALVALAWALGRPHDVGGLVVMSGYHFPTPRRDVPLFAPPAIPVIGDAMLYTWWPLLARLIAPRLIAKSFAPVRIPERFRAGFPLELSLRPSQLRASSEESALMIAAARGLQDRYRDLRPPLAILAGGDDGLVTTTRQAMRLHRAVPGSELRVLPRLGHMIHYSAHEAIEAAVLGVLARRAPRPERDRMRPAGADAADPHAAPDDGRAEAGQLALPFPV